MNPAAVLSILVKTQGIATATGDLHKLDKTGRQTSGSLRSVGDHAKRSGGLVKSLGSAAKYATPFLGGLGLAKALGAVNDEYREAQKTGAQTTAVIKSTGGAAKVTRKHVEDLAGAISKKAGIDDEAIQSSENMLLTFKNLRNETGKGNKIFDRATQTVTDMSVALGQSGKSSAIQLGKALNDPIKGITALRRVGVTFSDDQQKQIKTLVKHGDTLKAQKIILKELGQEFGGSAKAQATAGDKLKVSLGNLAEAAGRILVPAFDQAAKFVSKLIDDFIEGKGIATVIYPLFYKVRDAIASIIPVISSVVDWFKQHKAIAVVLATALGLLIAPFATLAVGFGILYAKSKTFRDVVKTIGDVLAKLPGIAVTVWAAVKGAFDAAVKWVRTAMNNIVAEIHKWDVLKAFLTPLLAAVGLVIKTAVTFWPIIFKTAFGVLKAIFTGAWTALKGLVTGGLQAISGVIKIVGGIFKGDFHQIWDGVKDVFKGALKALSGLVKGSAETLKGAAVAIGKGIASGVIDGLGSLGHLILQKFKDAAGFVKDQVGGLFSGIGKIVGIGSGDGIGKSLAGGALPAGGAFGGSLMGARSSLRPFAAIGSRFGLHVSDGKRAAGTRTASGGISYHSTGEAIDMSDGRGPDPNKLAFFNYLKGHFGGRLAELIYTPGGVGVKDGHPFRYTGKVAADHFDHVHVAFDSGAPGLGDGLGRASSALGRFKGEGIGFDATAKLAESVGLPGVTFAQIAHGESHYNPKAIGHDPGGTLGLGLWQITTKYNDDIIRKYGGQQAMLDPHTNALAARDIWRRQGRKAWYGTKYVTGWNLHYKGGKGGGVKTPKLPKMQKNVTSKVTGGKYDPTVVYPDKDSPSDEQIAAGIFHQKVAGTYKPPAVAKGFTSDQRPAAASDDGEDPNQPLIDAQNAAAAAAQALKDAIDAVKASIDAQTAFATGVANTSNFQLTKTLADLLSGHIVGYGVAGRAFTPGTGVEVAYAPSML